MPISSETQASQVPASQKNTPNPKLYTIGYATKPIAVFIAQLKQYDIQAVADVRSVPYSKVFYDYHQEAIASTLRQHHIHYVYVGEELGPRSKDPAHYNDDQQVQFDRLMQADLFLSGIQRIQKGLDKPLNIALMCAEKDPATCHRSLLIGYYLQQHQPQIGLEHILHNGELESQCDLKKRVSQLHSKGSDLFLTPEQMAEQSYQQQLKLTSYRKPASDQ